VETAEPAVTTPVGKERSRAMRVAKDNCVYSFSKSHQPAVRVTASAKVTLETMDCYGDQLRDGSGRQTSSGIM